MSSNSIAHLIKRSFLPESKLIKDGDVHALAIKYEERMGVATRAAHLLEAANPHARRVQGERPFSEYEVIKDLGSIMVTGHSSPAFTATDPLRPEVAIKREASDVVELGLVRFGNDRQLRADFGLAARYVHLQDRFEGLPVAMLTIPAVGRMAVAQGFRPMEVDTADTNTLHLGRLHAVHEAHTVINGGEFGKTTFEPAAVYMPADTFVDTFRP